MRFERTFQQLVILSAAITAIFAAHRVLASEGKSLAIMTKAPAGGRNTAPTSPRNFAILKKKGVGRIGCVYTIYVTVNETIDVCYPNQYSDLRKHILKWIPVMQDYWDKNVVDDKQKIDRQAQEVGMMKFGKSLNKNICELTKPLIENLSKNIAQDEIAIKDLLEQPDEPGRHYGCL